MSAVFDTLPKASFNGIEFSIEGSEVSGSIREHTHVYSHVDGGDNEIIGLNPYVIELDANFQATSLVFPESWPFDLNRLVAMFESKTVGDLVVPTRGTMKAYCCNWSIKMSAKIRSGEKCKLRFKQDSDTTFDASNITTQPAQLIFDTAAKSFVDTANDQNTDPDALTAILNAINTINAIADTAGMYSNRMAASIAQITAMLTALDRTVNSFQRPDNSAVMRSLHDLIYATIRLNEDIQSTRGKLRQYIAPTTMSIQQIATNLYGDASRAADLIGLNSITDPFEVKVGTPINYYPA